MKTRWQKSKCPTTCFPSEEFLSIVFVSCTLVYKHQGWWREFVRMELWEKSMENSGNWASASISRVLLVEFFVFFLVEWIALEIFLRTNIFSGIHQLLFHIIFRFISDFYLMLVTPILWIWKSRKANWQGWGERKEKNEKFFYFVRKPDLFHDLMA